jgi:hypothetical protein
MFDDDGELAIERAVLLAHPTAEVRRIALPDGGSSELVGFLALRVEEPVPHWLVVSRGFTELGEKAEEDPELSGWGFELTCRLPLRSDDEDVSWIARWMQSVEAYLSDKITFLEPYHHMSIVEPAPGDQISALVVVEDPELGDTESRNGRFTFFQMVGLTADEYEALIEWDARGLVELLRAREPLFFSDPKRSSLLRDPEFAHEVAEGRARDGSSIGILYGMPLLWFLDHRDVELHLSTDAVPILHAAMRNRLAHGNPMVLYGDRRRSVRADGSLAIQSQVNVALRAEEGISAVETEDGARTAIIRMSEAAIAQLANVLEAKPGTYTLPELPRVRFIVVTPERFREPSYPA